MVQRRFGFNAAEASSWTSPESSASIWMDEELHRRAESAFRTAGEKRLSLVDCVSFEIMRRRGCETAFAFDEHFEEHGFTTLKP